MKKILLTVLFAFSLSACSSNKDAVPVDAAAAKAAISSAKVENKKVRKIGFEWKMSSKMLSKASKATKAGDYKQAVKLANTVKRYAKLGQKQAEIAKTAGPKF
jgi:uncharacterized protein YcfL